MGKIPESVNWLATGKTLGGGGQSQVLAVKPKAGSKFPDGIYAMKVLRNVGSVQAKKRFRREIAAIQKVSDPRILKVCDFNEEGSDFHFYVTPNYGGKFENLAKLVFSKKSPFRGKPFPCLEFIAECAEALVAIHDQKIVHRDIKPGNILVEEKTLKPLILDFGCCQIEDGEQITLTDEGVGTKEYMAPECEAGSSFAPTPKADIYSLGKVLWTLVTGQKAFARENPAFTSKNLSKVLPEHPDCWHLTRIFERTIRRNPENRFPNAGDLSMELRRLSSLVVGRMLPLELIGKVCPMCGTPTDRPTLKKYEVQLWCVFGNPMPEGTTATQCTTCGFLSAWDYRPLGDRMKDLESMD